VRRDESGDFARRLLELVGTSQAAEGHPRDVVLVLRAIEHHLGELVGRTGYDLLLGRALSRAGRSHAFPERLSSDGRDGSVLDAIDAAVREGELDGHQEALEAALSELVTLTTRFLGASMTTRIIVQAFPDHPIGTGEIATENEDA